MRPSRARLALPSIAVLAALAASGAFPATAQEAPPVVVALRTSGQFVTGDAGSPGFDVEMLDRFLAWYRVTQRRELATSRLSVETVPALLEAVQSGRAQIGLGGITVTQERDRVVDFSLPYLPVKSVLIAPAGAVSGDDWRTALQGKRVGALTGSTNAALLATLSGEVPELVADTSFPTNEALFTALRGTSGRLQAAVVDVAHYWALGKDEGIVLVDTVGPPQGLGFVLAEGSALRQEVDAFVREFTGSTAYYHLVRKYFGGDAEQMVRMAR